MLLYDPAVNVSTARWPDSQKMIEKTTTLDRNYRNQKFTNFGFTATNLWWRSISILRRAIDCNPSYIEEAVEYHA
jgi:hypothetical protein